MIISREDYLESIIERLSLLTSNIEIANRNLRYGLNRAAEDFYANFLNLIYDYDLSNGNDEVRNLAAIDLIDEKNRIAIQVTSNTSFKKVKETLKKYEEKSFRGRPFVEQFDRLIILIITNKKSHRAVYNRLSEKNFRFDPNEDIWDVNDIISKLSASNYPLAKLKEAAKFLEDNIVFQQGITDKAGCSFCPRGENEQTESIFTNKILPKCFTNYLPVIPESGVIGRDDIITQVHNKLTDEKNVVMLCGLGGIGKTAVMQKVCNDIAKDGSENHYVAWIISGDSLIDEFLNLREFLGVSSVLSREIAFNEIIKKLKRIDGTLFLFIDNMNRRLGSKELSVINSLQPKVRVMITSRIENEVIPSIRIDALNLESAVTVFYEYYKGDKEQKYKKVVTDIVSSVKQHTLLVELLAKAARKSGGSLYDFCEKLKEKGLYHSFEHKIWTSEYDENLTIQECVIRLYDNFDLLSKEQKRIMRLFSIFTPEREIYYKVAEWSDFHMNEVDELIELAWLERGGIENGYHIHQIIKDSLVQQIKICKDKVNLSEYGNLIKYVSDTKSYLSEDLDYIRLKERIVIADNIAEYLEGYFDSEQCRHDILLEHSKAQGLNIATLFYNIASVYVIQGSHEKMMIDMAYEPSIIEYLAGITRPDTATTYDYSPNEIFEKALHYYGKALEIFMNYLGSDHADVIISIYVEVGKVVLSFGDTDNAFSLFEEAVNFGKEYIKTKCIDEPENQILNRVYLQMAEAYCLLADVYMGMGRRPGYPEDDKSMEALDCLGKSLEIRLSILGNEHLDIASVYFNMAAVYGYYREKSDYEKAIELCIKAIKILEKLAEPNQLSLAAAYLNISRLYLDKGDNEKAVLYIKKAEISFDGLQGIHFLYSAELATDIAYMSYLLGEYDKALEYYRKNLSINAQVFEIENLSMATTFNGIANTYRAMEDSENAIKYYKKALDIREHELGHYNPRTANTYRDMANLFEHMKDYNRALEFYEVALKINKKVKGEYHPFTIDIYEDIHNLYDNLGEYEKAADSYKTIFETLSKENTEWAKVYGEKVIAYIQKRFGVNHPDLIIIYDDMAQLWLNGFKADSDKAAEYILKRDLMMRS